MTVQEMTRQFNTYRKVSRVRVFNKRTRMYENNAGNKEVKDVRYVSGWGVLPDVVLYV